MVMAVLRLLPICFLKNGLNSNKLESVAPSAAAEVVTAYQFRDRLVKVQNRLGIA